MHAFAAVQSVLAPVLRLKQTTFPAEQITVEALRRVWQQRVEDLVQIGYPPVQRQQAAAKAKLCPHKLFGPDNRDGVPCCFDRICPFCWGLRVALTFENVLRALERRPDCQLWFVKSERPKVRRRAEEIGRIQHGKRFLLALQAPTSSRRSSSSWAISRDPFSIAQAVAWLFPYPEQALLGPVDELVKSLAERQGVHESSTTGIFRSASSVRQISQCRRNLIAPVLRVEEDYLDPRFHEAEPLLAAVDESFDHLGFVMPLVKKQLGGLRFRLTWGGRLEVVRESVLLGRPAVFARPLAKVYRRQATDGVLCCLPGAGYFVFRPARLVPRETVMDTPGQTNLIPAFPSLPEVTRTYLPYRNRTYVLEPLISWIWRMKNGMPPDGVRSDPSASRPRETGA